MARRWWCWFPPSKAPTPGGRRPSVARRISAARAPRVPRRTSDLDEVERRSPRPGWRRMKSPAAPLGPPCRQPELFAVPLRAGRRRAVVPVRHPARRPVHRVSQWVIAACVPSLPRRGHIDCGRGPGGSRRPRANNHSSGRARSRGLVSPGPRAGLSSDARPPALFDFLTLVFGDARAPPTRRRPRHRPAAGRPPASLVRSFSSPPAVSASFLAHGPSPTSCSRTF